MFSFKFSCFLGTVAILFLACQVSANEFPVGINLDGIRNRIENIKRTPLTEFQKIMEDPRSEQANGLLKNQCLIDEMDYISLEHKLFSRWKNLWQSKDIDSFMQLTSSDFSSGSFNFPEGAAWRAKDNILEYKWSPHISSLLDSQSAQSNSLKAYIKQFSSIDNIDFDTVSLLVERKDRNESDMAFNKARLLVRFDIRGVNIEGNRRNDRGTFTVDVKKENNYWKISSLLVKDGETVISRRSPSFSDVTEESNLLNAPQYLRREAIRRGGYALAVGDYNSDGRMDIYMGAHGTGTLWKGVGGGKFELDKNSGLGEDTLVKAAIFADFDNDGEQDLVLTRFTPAEEYNDIVYYKNNGGKFNKITDNISARTPSYYAMPAAVADFNNDQFLDFYVGFPGAKDFTVLDNIPESKFKTVQGLFYNNKQGGFSEVTAGVLPGRDVRSPLFPHSAIALDYDQDTDMDIIVIDDRNNLSPVYQNLGDGKFMQVADSIGVNNLGYGMNVSAGDINNDGLVDLLMTNVEFVSDKRISNSCITNWNTALSDQMRASGLRAFRNEGNGTFSEVTDSANLTWAGEATAGVEFIDYNNDGFQDIYVVNGLWSGTDNNEDISSLFARSALVDAVKNEEELGKWPYMTDDPQSNFMKVLINHKGGLSDDSSPDTKLSMGGYQRNRLFRNNGDNTFTEVGYLEGVDIVADGYVVAKADINNDGRIDLILRNADPGVSEHTFPALQVLNNSYQSDNKSLTLQLESSGGNHDSVGAFVVAWRNGKPQVQHLLANNGASQSQRVLHFGMKDEDKIDRLVIHWPSGKIQEARNLQAGFFHIKEGEIDNTPIVSAINLAK